MSTNALTALEPIDDTTLNRAQYEAFEFELEAPGLMLVRNGSYGDEKVDHEYVVNVEDGVPVACECPSFEYRGGPCKHQVAIAIREPVLTAASDHDADPEAKVATDGGQTIVEPGERPDGCECSPPLETDDSEVIGDTPCFPCWLAGFEDPNPEVYD